MTSRMNRRGDLKLILFVAGDTLNSSLAIANLSSICRAHLSDRHQLEIVDVLREPNRALQDSVFMTPTLLKLSPKPVRIIVGTLSDTQPVLDALGLSGSSV